MPAANELLNWTFLRSVINVATGAGSFWVWKAGGDPGTGTLPNNRIATYGEMFTYLHGLTNTTQCPNYTQAIAAQSLPSVFPVSLSADGSGMQTVTFTIDADAVPSTGMTYSVEVYVDSVLRITEGGLSADTPITRSHGSINPGSNVQVIVSAILSGTGEIAEGQQSTTAT